MKNTFIHRLLNQMIHVAYDLLECLFIELTDQNKMFFFKVAYIGSQTQTLMN